MYSFVQVEKWKADEENIKAGDGRWESFLYPSPNIYGMGRRQPAFVVAIAVSTMSPRGDREPSSTPLSSSPESAKALRRHGEALGSVVQSAVDCLGMFDGDE